MFHMAREVANRLMTISIKHKGMTHKTEVYLPLVDGVPYMSNEKHDAVCDKLLVPRGSAYTLSERQFVRTGKR